MASNQYQIIQQNMEVPGWFKLYHSIRSLTRLHVFEDLAYIALYILCLVLAEDYCILLLYSNILIICIVLAVWLFNSGPCLFWKHIISECNKLFIVHTKCGSICIIIKNIITYTIVSPIYLIMIVALPSVGFSFFVASCWGTRKIDYTRKISNISLGKSIILIISNRINLCRSKQISSSKLWILALNYYLLSLSMHVEYPKQGSHLKACEIINVILTRYKTGESLTDIKFSEIRSHCPTAKRYPLYFAGDLMIISFNLLLTSVLIYIIFWGTMQTSEMKDKDFLYWFVTILFVIYCILKLIVIFKYFMEMYVAFIMNHVLIDKDGIVRIQNKMRNIDYLHIIETIHEIFEKSSHIKEQLLIKYENKLSIDIIKIIIEYSVDDLPTHDNNYKVSIEALDLIVHNYNKDICVFDSSLPSNTKSNNRRRTKRKRRAQSSNNNNMAAASLIIMNS